MGWGGGNVRGGQKGENCPALIRCKKKKEKKELGQKIISVPLGKIKSSAGREWRCYRLALISFTDECEMTSSVVWTHTRHHYTLLYPDLLHFLLHTGSYSPKKPTAAGSD